ERQAEQIAEGDQRPFGGIGLGFLQRALVCLTGCRGDPMPHPAAVADNARLARADRDANARRVGTGVVSGGAGPLPTGSCQMHCAEIVSRSQPSKPNTRLASAMACQPSMYESSAPSGAVRVLMCLGSTLPERSWICSW